jgi:hypothetical protein
MRLPLTLRQYRRNSQSSQKQEKGTRSFCLSEQLGIFLIAEALPFCSPVVSSFNGKRFFRQPWMDQPLFFLFPPIAEAGISPLLCKKCPLRSQAHP